MCSQKRNTLFLDASDPNSHGFSYTLVAPRGDLITDKWLALNSCLLACCVAILFLIAGIRVDVKKVTVPEKKAGKCAR